MKYLLSLAILFCFLICMIESAPANSNDNIVVMVIDSGIGKHAMLNGFVQYRNTEDYNDDLGHGTHVTGIIVHGNKGLSETLCSRVKIISCKAFYKDSILDPVYVSTQCIKRAIKLGVNYINYSGGGSEASVSERQALIEFGEQGGITIAAAGNDGVDITGPRKYYPASYSNVPGMVIVQNRGPDGRLAATSNSHPLALTAEGEHILSTFPNNKFAEMSGTSMAAPAILHEILKLKCKGEM